MGTPRPWREDPDKMMKTVDLRNCVPDFYSNLASLHPDAMVAWDKSKIAIPADGVRAIFSKAHWVISVTVFCDSGDVHHYEMVETYNPTNDRTILGVFWLTDRIVRGDP